MGSDTEKGRVRVLHKELLASLKSSGKTLEEVRRETGLHRKTITEMLASRGRFRVKSVAKFVRAVGGEDVYEYIHPADRPGADEGAASEPDKSTHEIIHEWEEIDALSPVVGTSNDLQYQILKMRHRDQPSYLGRAKQYNLKYMSAEDRQAKRECLLRHPEICRRLTGKPQFPVNEKVASLDNGRIWWVIDRWIEGVTLEERLESEPLVGKELKNVVTQIAEGLQTLHENAIIRRELAPAFILLENDTGRVVLTDFELGKLLDGSPTVGGTSWRHEEYLAVEVKQGKADFRADLYSWGRICLEAALGNQDRPEDERVALAESPLPRGVRAIVEACLERNREQRPASMQDVLAAVRRWR